MLHTRIQERETFPHGLRSISIKIIVILTLVLPLAITLMGSPFLSSHCKFHVYALDKLCIMKKRYYVDINIDNDMLFCPLMSNLTLPDVASVVLGFNYEANNVLAYQQISKQSDNAQLSY